MNWRGVLNSWTPVHPWTDRNHRSRWFLSYWTTIGKGLWSTWIVSSSSAAPPTTSKKMGKKLQADPSLSLYPTMWTTRRIRRSSSFNTGRIEHLYKDLHERMSNIITVISKPVISLTLSLRPRSHPRAWQFLRWSCITEVCRSRSPVLLLPLPCFPADATQFHHLKWRAHAPRRTFLTDLSFDSTDLTDTTNLVYIVSSVQPTEIYNLAAQSHVKVSFDMAEYTVRSSHSFLSYVQMHGCHDWQHEIAIAGRCRWIRNPSSLGRRPNLWFDQTRSILPGNVPSTVSDNVMV